MRLHTTLLVTLLVAGCAPRPNPQFTGENPSYAGVAKSYPSLIPSISKLGQNRPPVAKIEVFWNDQLPAQNFKMVGVITSTHNPPTDVNDQMIEFSKQIGMDAIVLRPPGTVRVLGVPKRVLSATVFVKE